MTEKYLKICSGILALCLLLCSHSALGLSIKPAMLDLQLAPGENKTGVFTVKNPSDGEARYRASVAHFRLTREGDLNPVPPDEYAISEWIKFNPREFTLGPNAQQQVRYTIVLPRSATSGDFWGVLEFKDLSVQKIEGANSESGTNVNLSVSSAIVVPIFVQIGKVSYDWSLLELEALPNSDGVAAILTLSNLGNGRVPFRSAVDVIDAAGEVVAHQERGVISLFPHSERVISLPIETDLEPGDYVVRAQVISEKAGETHSGETLLRIPSTP